MKKRDYYKFLEFQRRRERRAVTRKRKLGKYKDAFTTFTKDIQFKQKHDEKIIENFRSELDDFLKSNGNSSKKEATHWIPIPKTFSLERDYDSTIETLALIRKSMMKLLGTKITIDFSICENVDFSSLFLLNVLLNEYLRDLKSLDRRLLIFRAYPQIEITHSNFGDVNLKLLANRLVPQTLSNTNEFIPISSINLIKGTKSQKHYAENRKGITATEIRKYINSSIFRHGFFLNEEGESSLDGMISEILNNAEDHSPWNTWYAFANLFETNRSGQNPEIVGEINLAFMNFGFSIYEGFEETKSRNLEIYTQMEQMFSLVSVKKGGSKFSKENLFTLYALQEGISRLKFEKESRGTGTMKFIQSFLSLGDYEDKAKKFIPHLLIYSGNTLLKCSNQFSPFTIDDVNYLSLNSQNDLKEPPDGTHLQSLNYKFPGTLLIVKIYLNEDHLKKKLERNGTKNN